MAKMSIAKKYGYNHPHVNEGDPRKHPDWNKWAYSGTERLTRHYCKEGSGGYNCPECKYWYGCIMQMYHWSVLCEYVSGRIDKLEELERIYEKPEVKPWMSVFEDLIS